MNNDLKLYAIWGPYYDVKFDANTGAGFSVTAGTMPADTRKSWQTDLTLDAKVPTSSGAVSKITTKFVPDNGTTIADIESTKTVPMKFSAWNTAANGTGDSYSPGGAYKKDEAATLYAQWTADPATYSSITLPAPTKQGYDLAGWQKASDGATIPAGTTSYAPEADDTLTAQWTPSTNTAYKVEHYFMDTSGSYPATATYTDNLTGTTNASTSAVAKSGADTTGFSVKGTSQTGSGTVTQETIDPAGTTVVKIYYERNQYDFTCAADTGTTLGSGASAAKKYYYGEQVTVSATLDAGYTWVKWAATGAGSTGQGGTQADITDANKKTATITMPAGDLTMTATATPSTTTPYKVLHYKEDVSGGNYTLADTENLTGTTGTLVTPPVKSYTGFGTTATQTKTITGDGLMEVEYYYPRNSYQFTLGSAVGASTGSSSTSDTYKFGAEITLDGSALSGYTWTGWKAEGTGAALAVSDGQWTGDGPTAAATKITMPAGNLDMTPVVAASTSTPYTVNHHFMNVTGTGYDTTPEPKTGKTGDQTSAAAKTVAGFTCDGTTRGGTGGSITQKEITGDGKTVVDIWYTRLQYDLAYADDGNTDVDTSASTPAGKVYYDAKVRAVAAPKTGYTWQEWEADVASVGSSTMQTYEFNMPAHDLTMKAKSTASTSTPYKVEHYQELLAGGYPSAPTLTETAKTGTTGDPTAATAMTGGDWDGFTCVGSDPTNTSATAITQETIAAAGTTVVKVYYKRNAYDYVLDTATGFTPGATCTKTTASVLYGTKIYLSGSVGSGWAWDHWASSDTSLQADVANIGDSFDMPAGNLRMTPVLTPTSGTSYTVRHFRQNLDGTTYPSTTPFTESLTGTTGDPTAATAKTGGEWDGFTCVGSDPANTAAAAITQGTIDGAGTTVVDVYYKRNSYTFTLDDDGNVDTTGSSASGSSFLFGENVTLKAAAKQGYTWSTWVASGDGAGTGAGRQADEPSDDTTITMPAGNLTMKATATAASGTAYTVEHWLEDVSGGTYTKDPADDAATGTTGDPTAAAARTTYTGFACAGTDPADGTSNIVQEAIAANGSTVVKIYYERNRHSYTLGSATGADTAGSSPTGTVTLPYGAPITLAASAQAGYTWQKWEASGAGSAAGGGTQGDEAAASATIAMPDGDLTMTPVVGASAGTAYTVRHFKQDLSGGYPAAPDESDPMAGTTGDLTAAVTRAGGGWDGFTAQPFSQAAIAANGSTVVDIYYERNAYQFTLGSAAGASTVGSTPSGPYKFGEPITLAGAALTGYTWSKWAASGDGASGVAGAQGDVTASAATIQMPAGDIEMTPVVKPDPTTPYEVRHLLMDLDGVGYTLDDTQLLYGEAGANASPALNSYVGFTAPAAQSVVIDPSGSTVVEYRYARNKYTFTLGSATGADTAGSSLSGPYFYGETVTLSAAAQFGYRVGGWTATGPGSTAGGGTQGDVAAAAATFPMPAGDIEMTPAATAGTPDAVYHINDGTTTGAGATNTVRHEFGKPWTTLGESVFSRTNYKLVGWNTEPDGSGYTYTCATDQPAWLSTSDLHLYAVWKDQYPPIAKVIVNTLPASYTGAELTDFPLDVQVYDLDDNLLVRDVNYTQANDSSTLTAVPGTGAKVGLGGMPLSAGVYTVDTVVTELGQATNNSYRITTAFWVDRAPLVVRADDAAKAIGEADPAFAASASGLLGGDALGAVDISRESGEAEGVYDIRPTRAQVLDASGADVTSNYDIAYSPAGKLTIGLPLVGRSVDVSPLPATYAGGELDWSATLSVGATDVYGRALSAQAAAGSQPGFEWEVTSCTPLAATGARLGATGKPVGAGYYLATVKVTYPNDPGAGATTTTASFYVGRAPLEVAAGDASKAAGAADPAFRWTAAGLAGGDKVASVRVARAAGEAAGTYAITPSAAVVTDAAGKVVTSDYDITYKAGSLKVTGSAAGPGSGGKGGGAAGSAQAAIDADVANAVKTLTDADPAGSEFGLLQLKCAKAKKTSLKLTWKAVPGAARYVLFSSQCGKKFKYSVAYQGAAKSFTAKKLKKKTSYKFMCFAYDASGKRIATAKTVHAFTAGGKNGNVKKVTFKKKLTLKLKKSKKLKGKAVKMAGKALKQHRKVMYESSDPKVATVGAKNGKVKAVGKGKCVIYAYACDGKMAKCKVTVK